MRDRSGVKLEWITLEAEEAISAIRLSVRRGLEAAAVSVIDRATSEERRRKCPIAREAEKKRGRREGRGREGSEGRWHLQYLRFFCNPEMLLRSLAPTSEEEDNGYERVTSLGQSVWLGRRRPSPGKPE